MIMLDTNIVAELMKTRPADTVKAWMNAQDSDKLYLSAITIGEITCGLRVLPDGKRRSALRERFERFVALAFDQRVLAYDESAARGVSSLDPRRYHLLDGFPCRLEERLIRTQGGRRQEYVQPVVQLAKDFYPQAGPHNRDDEVIDRPIHSITSLPVQVHPRH
jgi:predicted nucleic acid-binding protein